MAIKNWFKSGPNEKVQKEAILQYMRQRSIDYKEFKMHANINALLDQKEYDLLALDHITDLPWE